MFQRSGKLNYLFLTSFYVSVLLEAPAKPLRVVWRFPSNLLKQQCDSQLYWAIFMGFSQQEILHVCLSLQRDGSDVELGRT